MSVSYSNKETEEPEDTPDDGMYWEEVSISYSNKETEEPEDMPDDGTYHPWPTVMVEVVDMHT